MRFTTQTTTTINPMTPRTNQISRLISTSSSRFPMHPVVGAGLAYVWWLPTSRFCPTNLLGSGGRRWVSLDTRTTLEGAARGAVVGLPPAGLLDARRVKMIGMPTGSRPGVAQTMSAVKKTHKEIDAMTVIFLVAAGACRRLVTGSTDSSGDGRGCYCSSRRRFSWSLSRSLRRLRLR